jgi:hypothetical protein
LTLHPNFSSAALKDALDLVAREFIQGGSEQEVEGIAKVRQRDNAYLLMVAA